MEIKRINGAINTYTSRRVETKKRVDTSAPARNVDRVEFGFEKALGAAKKGIAAEIRADASPEDIAEAKKTIAQDVPSEILASYILDLG